MRVLPMTEFSSEELEFRDKVALRVLPMILNDLIVSIEEVVCTNEEVAIDCYMMADAMLDIRNGGSK